MLKGGCLCKEVTFTVVASDAATACHCSQCRKQSGHYWASGVGKEAGFDIQGTVRWFDATSTAKRGFCPACGSFLFWKHHNEDTMSFSLGAIDGPTGLSLKKHIFCADKGDYYEIADDVPQKAD